MKKAPNIVYDHVVPSAGHNDIYARSDFQEAMREALGTLQRSLCCRRGLRNHLRRDAREEEEKCEVRRE